MSAMATKHKFLSCYFQNFKFKPSHNLIVCVCGLMLLGIPGTGFALDRKQALSVIQKSEYYPRSEILTPLPLGNPVNIEVVIKTVMGMDSRLGNELNSGYGCAGKLGFLKIRGQTKKVFGTNMGTFYQVDVTPKGKENGWVVHEDVYGYKAGYVMPIYKITAARVTGIKKPNSSTAIVDFETVITEVLPAGKCIQTNSEEIKDSFVGKHQATLELYDDGWRVESAREKGAKVDWLPLQPERGERK